MTHVTWRLTAKNRDWLQHPMLSNQVWAGCTVCLHREHVCIAQRLATLPHRHRASSPASAVCSICRPLPNHVLSALASHQSAVGRVCMSQHQHSSAPRHHPLDTAANIHHHYNATWLSHIHHFHLSASTHNWENVPPSLTGHYTSLLQLKPQEFC